MPTCRHRRHRGRAQQRAPAKSSQHFESMDSRHCRSLPVRPSRGPVLPKLGARPRLRQAWRADGRGGSRSLLVYIVASVIDLARPATRAQKRFSLHDDLKPSCRWLRPHRCALCPAQGSHLRTAHSPFQLRIPAASKLRPTNRRHGCRRMPPTSTKYAAPTRYCIERS